MKESTRVLVALGAAVVLGTAISLSASAPLLARRRHHRADRLALGERDPDDGDSARRLAAHHGRRVGERREGDRTARRPDTAGVRAAARGCRRGGDPARVVAVRAASAGWSEAAAARRGGRSSRAGRLGWAEPDIRRVAHVADSVESRRRGGKRPDGVADPLHDPARPRDRAQLAGRRARRSSASSRRSATRC